jgi:hypothetical protein
MTHPLRTIAFLMLVAGLSLGVFASRALRALGQAGPTDAVPASPARIELLVDLYRRDFRLDERQSDQVRQELLRYDRRVRDRLLELRQQHAAEFRGFYDEAEEQIRAILAEAQGG